MYKRQVQLREPIAAAVVASARGAGFIVNAAAPATVRLAPPLVIEANELDTFVDALPAILDEAR